MTELFFSATGGTAPYVWTAENLPAGLLFSNATSGDTNRGWLRGTPEDSTPGTTVVFTVTDAEGTVDSVSRSIRIREPGALAVDSPSPGSHSFLIGDAAELEFTAIGGTGPYEWTCTTGSIPGGLSFTDNGDGTAHIHSTEVTGSEGQSSETFQVEDSLGATDSVTLTVRRVETDIPDPGDPPPPGQYDRNIGMVAGVKSSAQAITNVGNAMQNTDDHPSTERLALIRLGINWDGVWASSASPPHMSGNTYVDGTYQFTDSAGRIAAIRNIDQANAPGGSVYAHIGLNYGCREFVQTISLGHGTAVAGQSYITLDDLPGNPEYPGLSGSGAGNWIGHSIHGPGIPTTGGLVTIAGNEFTSGNHCNLANIGSRLTNGSGEYWIGGSGNERDQKMTPRCKTAAQGGTDALEPYGDWCNQMTARLGSRVARIELSNEINHNLGCSPYPDVELQYRNLCHGYVGVKMENPDIIVCTPGTGNHNPAGESSHQAGYLHPKTWLRRIKEEHTTNQAGYFEDLCSSMGVTSPNGLPFDSVSIHPYARGPYINPATNVIGDAAYVYNLFGGRAKVALTEQGPGWVPTGGNPENYPLTKTAAYNWWAGVFDILHGNVPWPYGQAFQGAAAALALPTGPTTTSSQITLTDRRALARQVFDVPTIFVISAPLPPHTPYEDSADMGLHTYANGPAATGTPKWTDAGPDPMKAAREA